MLLEINLLFRIVYFFLSCQIGAHQVEAAKFGAEQNLEIVRCEC